MRNFFLRFHLFCFNQKQNLEKASLNKKKIWFRHILRFFKKKVLQFFSLILVFWKFQKTEYTSRFSLSSFLKSGSLPLKNTLEFSRQKLFRNILLNKTLILLRTLLFSSDIKFLKQIKPLETFITNFCFQKKIIQNHFTARPLVFYLLY